MGMDVFRPPSVFSYFSPSIGVSRARPVCAARSSASSRPRRRCAAPTSSTRWCSRPSPSAPTPRPAPRSTCRRLQRARGDARRSSSSGSNLLLMHGTMSTGHARQHHPRGDRGRRPPTRSSAPGPPSISSRRRRSIRWRDSMHVTRREFLLQTGQACVGYALGAAAFVAGVERFSADQRAGAGLGLSGARLRVPGRRQRRQQHGRAARRPPSTTRTPRRGARPGWPSPRDALLPITPLSIGNPFGLHPSLDRAADAVESSRSSSVVCNVGPLVQPLTRQDYQGGAPRPYQLFSHSDQVAQWQTSIADRVGADRVGRAHGRSLRRRRLRASRWSRRCRAGSSRAARRPRRSRLRRRRRRSTRCSC